MARLDIVGGTVVPMTEPGLSYPADVVIDDGVIVEAAPGRRAGRGGTVLDAGGALVLPGFVQTHVHVVQTLARFRADGLPLLRWLAERIWPYEAALDESEVASAARLGIAELLCGGTTAALDMGTGHSQDAIFAAAEALGIRLVSGLSHMDIGELVPKRLRATAAASLAEAERLGRRWHGAAGGRVGYAVAPRFALSCSDELLSGCVELAGRHGWLLHTHASENPEETAKVRERTGRGNVRYLADLGLAGERAVIAHCVHLDEDEVELLATTRSGVAHCPGSNLKLASGVADLPRLLGSGVRVGLGADGPPCNNRLSILHEMALAGTLHNLRHGAAAVDPWTVLELATWRGAELLGLAGIGRLTPGWKADVVVLDVRGWSLQPPGDPAAMVVYAADAGCVRHVVVDGNPVVVDGVLVSAPADAIRREAMAAAEAVDRRLVRG